MVKHTRTIPVSYNKNQIRIARQKEIIVLWISRGKSFAFGCAKADIGYRAAWQWKADDDIFKADCEQAYDIGTQGLEDVADNRAKRRSDTLLMFLMKGRDPKYRDNKTIVEVQAPRVSSRKF